MSRYVDYMREWAQKNPDKIKQYKHTYYTKFPEKKLYKSAKRNAKARNLEFNITEADIVIPELCPYLEIKLEPMPRFKNDFAVVSIDRIDNTKGYIPGNVQVISKLANEMKSSATLLQLKCFATNVLKHHT